MMPDLIKVSQWGKQRRITSKFQFNAAKERLLSHRVWRGHDKRCCCCGVLNDSCELSSLFPRWPLPGLWLIGVKMHCTIHSIRMPNLFAARRVQVKQAFLDGTSCVCMELLAQKSQDSVQCAFALSVVTLKSPECCTSLSRELSHRRGAHTLHVSVRAKRSHTIAMIA